MTTQTEALKLALEALVKTQWEGYNLPGSEIREAITAIKEALAQPEQEPVAWADHGVVNWIADKQFKHAALLYEAPQRTWVGLDNDDLVWIYSNSDKVGQAISNTESKLKEKNT